MAWGGPVQVVRTFKNSSWLAKTPKKPSAAQCASTTFWLTPCVGGEAALAVCVWGGRGAPKAEETPASSLLSTAT